MNDLSRINHQMPQAGGVRAAQPSHEKRDRELWQVSLKFEAMFLQQVMSSMRKSIPESGFLPHGFAEKSYQSMMDQAIADAGGQRGALGIAESIYSQLKRDGGDGGAAVRAADRASDTLRSVAVEQYRAAIREVGHGTD